MPRTLWIDTAINSQIASGARTAFSLMTGITEIDSRLSSMTLLRTIVGVDIAHLVHDSGEGSQLVALGIGVATQEAVAADTLPDPDAMGDFPVRGWVWRALYRTYGFAADQPAIFNQRADKDIRAKRILDNGEGFMNIVNTAEQGSTGSIVVLGLVRQLWLIK